MDFPGQRREENFGSAANQGSAAEGADFDADGVSNLLEFAFGLNPTVPNPKPLALSHDGLLTQREVPVRVTEDTDSGPSHHAVFLRRKDHLAAGLTYSVETSHNLTHWQASTAASELIGSDGEMDIVRWPIPAPAAGETKQFMRVRVSGDQ